MILCLLGGGGLAASLLLKICSDSCSYTINYSSRLRSLGAAIITGYGSLLFLLFLPLRWDILKWDDDWLRLLLLCILIISNLNSCLQRGQLALILIHSVAHDGWKQCLLLQFKNSSNSSSTNLVKHIEHSSNCSGSLGLNLKLFLSRLLMY